jgi:hypothetical protein
MKLNIIQIILIGVCLAITIYFTYATINLITTGNNVIVNADIPPESITLGFLDYGMIQYYVFMAVMTFLLFMLAGSGKKE